MTFLELKQSMFKKALTTKAIKQFIIGINKKQSVIFAQIRFFGNLNPFLLRVLRLTGSAINSFGIR